MYIDLLTYTVNEFCSVCCVDSILTSHHEVDNNMGMDEVDADNTEKRMETNNKNNDCENENGCKEYERQGSNQSVSEECPSISSDERINSTRLDYPSDLRKEFSLNKSLPTKFTKGEVEESVADSLAVINLTDEAASNTGAITKFSGLPSSYQKRVVESFKVYFSPPPPFLVCLPF